MNPRHLALAIVALASPLVASGDPVSVEADLSLAEVRSSPFRGDQVNSICTLSELSDFTALGERAAIIRMADERAFLVEFEPGCVKLNNREVMQFTSRSLCVRPGSVARMTDVQEYERFPLRKNRTVCVVSRINVWQSKSVLPMAGDADTDEAAR